MVTLLLFELGRVFVGTAIIIEIVFAWPGIGRLAASALFRGDIFLVQAVVMVAATATAVLNLLADLFYFAVDPPHPPPGQGEPAMNAHRLWAELRRRPVIIAAIIIAVALVASSVLVPLISDLDASAPRLARRLQAPSWTGGEGGLLGTDSLGRDLFLRIMYGMRTSFAVGALAALLGAALGTLIGLISGYFGGAVDAVLMRLTDIELAFPGILLVMVLVRVLERGIVGVGDRARLDLVDAVCPGRAGSSADAADQ